MLSLRLIFEKIQAIAEAQTEKHERKKWQSYATIIQQLRSSIPVAVLNGAYCSSLDTLISVLNSTPLQLRYKIIAALKLYVESDAEQTQISENLWIVLPEDVNKFLDILPTPNQEETKRDSDVFKDSFSLSGVSWLRSIVKPFLDNLPPMPAQEEFLRNLGGKALTLTVSYLKTNNGTNDAHSENTAFANLVQNNKADKDVVMQLISPHLKSTVSGRFDRYIKSYLLSSLSEDEKTPEKLLDVSPPIVSNIVSELWRDVFCVTKLPLNDSEDLEQMLTKFNRFIEYALNENNKSEAVRYLGNIYSLLSKNRKLQWGVMKLSYETQIPIAIKRMNDTPMLDGGLFDEYMNILQDNQKLILAALKNRLKNLAFPPVFNENIRSGYWGIGRKTSLKQYMQERLLREPIDEKKIMKTFAILKAIDDRNSERIEKEFQEKRNYSFGTTSSALYYRAEAQRKLKKAESEHVEPERLNLKER